MATILAISSQVAYGNVGLSAYQFALQRLGHKVIAFPTVSHITHPKLGKPKGMALSGDMLADMGAELISMRLDEKIDYIISGYFNSIDQAKSVKWLVTQLKTKNPDIEYCCDPVMGDYPKGLYVGQEIAEFIRDHLAPLADLVTPNQFEAEFLGELHNPETLLKSVNDVKNIYIDKNGQLSQNFDRADIHLNGAGDLFAALFVGHRLNGMISKQALGKTSEFMTLLAIYSLKHGCDQLPIIENQQYL